MTNIAITRNKNTVSATYLPYAAYNALVEGANKRNAKIVNNADHTTVVTCNSIKDAKDLVAEWTANYNANRKVEPTVAPTQKPKASKGKTANNKVVVTVDGKQFFVDASALVPAQTSKKSKPTATKGKTTSSTKKTTAPRKSKGNAFDYSVIKGKTNTDKNKALHATLVSMGMKDSRSADYQAIWANRPWAK